MHELNLHCNIVWHDLEKTFLSDIFNNNILCDKWYTAALRTSKW